MKKILLVQLVTAVVLLFSQMSYADDYYGHRGYGDGERYEHHRHHHQSYYYQQPPVIYYQQQPPVRYYQPPPVNYYPQPQVIYPQPPRSYSGNELRLNW